MKNYGKADLAKWLLKPDQKMLLVLLGGLSLVFVVSCYIHAVRSSRQQSTGMVSMVQLIATPTFIFAWFLSSYFSVQEILAARAIFLASLLSCMSATYELYRSSGRNEGVADSPLLRWSTKMLFGLVIFVVPLYCPTSRLIVLGLTSLPPGIICRIIHCWLRSVCNFMQQAMSVGCTCVKRSRRRQCLHPSPCW